jgi:hypothetical protein
VSLRFRAASNVTQVSQVAYAEPPTIPAIPGSSLVCQCPPLDECRNEHKFPDQFCGMHSWVIDYNSTFTMQQHVFVVPYVTTVLETVSSLGGCQWFVDLGAGPVQSGLTYQGEREVDQNKVTISFDATSTTCACCTTITFDDEGEYSQELNVHYAWRCLYSQPPAYMSIQRAAPVAYLNWTYEITAGVFTVRDAANVIQDQVDLNPLTLAQALVAINAMASVVAVANFGAIAADTMPATLMEDRAAALLPWPFVAPLFLFPPDVREVEYYQDGKFGPAWRVFETVFASCGKVFPLKQNGCAVNPYDYTGGTTSFSEATFCQGISTEFVDWAPLYDPYASQNGEECNFTAFGGCSENYPLGGVSCDSSTGKVTWVETSPCEPVAYGGSGSWNWVVGAFGNRATYLGFSQEFCSDNSKLRETVCVDQTSQECDFCECAGGEWQVRCGSYRYESREGWRVAKAFQVVRL